jgi:hypothetical protein
MIKAGCILRKRREQGRKWEEEKGGSRKKRKAEWFTSAQPALF